MGYQQNPTSILYSSFVPDPLNPFDLIVPANTEAYIGFPVPTLLINKPSGFATSRENGTVVRVDAGTNGRNMGLVKAGVTINFENLGTVTTFSVITNAGFDLNTINEVETLRYEDVSQVSNQSPYGRFNQVFYAEILYDDLVAAGKNYIDLGVKISHGAATSRTIRIGSSSSYYHLIERYSP